MTTAELGHYPEERPRAPLSLVQYANRLSSSFRYQHAFRQRRRFPAIAALLAFLIESEHRTHTTGIHLRKAFRQIISVQQRLILKLVPQVLAEVPILASGAQVAEEVQDCMQTLRIKERESA